MADIRIRSPLSGRRTRRYAAALLACAGLVVTACGSSGSSGGSASGGDSPGSQPGTANVAYAASLTNLNEKVIGPAFARAGSGRYAGRAGPSLALSKEIASGEITPNVFESIGGKPIEALEPKYTSWYVQFAASPIVVAYNPRSKYASQLKAIASGRKPLTDLFALMQQPGFRLGRTDPNVDPQGQAFILMLMLAQRQYHLPASALGKIIHGTPSSADSPTIFDEAALEPRLQAGQLDAASAYLSQAVQLHLPYIALPASINLGDPAQKSRYGTVSFKLANGMLAQGKPLTVDITVIGRQDLAAADAFVAYVLSRAGLALHKQGGYKLLTPQVFGSQSALPAKVRQELGQ
ncbi:MAG: substrate-binding domain-containing protein [Actinobacteria bacterium]|nr:substrate-binding domain-containing protein [Actinomycetota bacterium]